MCRVVGVGWGGGEGWGGVGCGSEIGFIGAMSAAMFILYVGVNLAMAGSGQRRYKVEKHSISFSPNFINAQRE